MYRRAVLAAFSVLLALVVAACSSSPFVASKKGARFHKPSCPWADQIRDADRVGFETREAAVAKGLEACPICKP